MRTTQNPLESKFSFTWLVFTKGASKMEFIHFGLKKKLQIFKMI